MDREIEEIKRRAGILSEQETFDMASFEKLQEFLDDEIEFLGKLGTVLGRTMAPDRARQILAVIGDRRQRLQQFGRAAKTQNAAGQKQSAGAHSQTQAGTGGGIGGNVDAYA